jgi:Fe-S-cluster-containing hydrogenase component 2
LRTLGVPAAADLESVLPSPQRLAQGPVAIIECFQEIPCDPCSAACRRGAILPFTDICGLPRVDHALCNGCGLCVIHCPGLAIFVVDLSKSSDRGEVRLPYEYLPLPSAGERVRCLDRAGRPLCEGVVVKVLRPRSFDRTALVTVDVPIEHALAVRGIRVSPQRDQEE